MDRSNDYTPQFHAVKAQGRVFVLLSLHWTTSREEIEETVRTCALLVGINLIFHWPRRPVIVPGRHHHYGYYIVECETPRLADHARVKLDSLPLGKDKRPAGTEKIEKWDSPPPEPAPRPPPVPIPGSTPGWENFLANVRTAPAPATTPASSYAQAQVATPAQEPTQQQDWYTDFNATVARVRRASAELQSALQELSQLVPYPQYSQYLQHPKIDNPITRTYSGVEYRSPSQDSIAGSYHSSFPSFHQ